MSVLTLYHSMHCTYLYHHLYHSNKDTSWANYTQTTYLFVHRDIPFVSHILLICHRKSWNATEKLKFGFRDNLIYAAKKLTQHNSTQNECWKNKWKIMKGQIVIPKSKFLLSVTELGTNLSGFIASKLTGYIPVFWYPDWMFATVIAWVQAGHITLKKSPLPRALPL